MKPISHPSEVSTEGKVPDVAEPHPVDRQVGLRIRMRRRELGISQEKLAEALGLTFQQVQKYERAANRVSASRLFDIACALNTSVSYFFDGFLSNEDAEKLGAADLAVHDLLFTADGVELANLFTKLPRGRVRRGLLDLMRAMAAGAQSKTDVETDVAREQVSSSPRTPGA
jgi:transcriptional regulator with XRE-family HTH domain